ncbi:hypothetical protein NLI96_g2165 [Meripilus lineatus]|uniref:Small EDRK-rich factor-like N-terminal domain-containing protein n=1 Tax=Meripilus lineatus TaxID=2056292 RepID=A0AAD5VBD0_9APHY|nr:hypothetical protein NLI96_g2165 [Physisporinus lineatus]
MFVRQYQTSETLTCEHENTGPVYLYSDVWYWLGSLQSPYVGGNQRDMDRAKAQKKAAAAAKGKTKESATSLQTRREKDAEALREKQKVKESTRGFVIS